MAESLVTSPLWHAKFRCMKVPGLFFEGPPFFHPQGFHKITPKIFFYLSSVGLSWKCVNYSMINSNPLGSQGFSKWSLFFFTQLKIWLQVGYGYNGYNSVIVWWIQIHWSPRVFLVDPPSFLTPRPYGLRNSPNVSFAIVILILYVYTIYYIVYEATFFLELIISKPIACNGRGSFNWCFPSIPKEKPHMQTG